MFKPEVITGPQGGHIAFVFDMNNAFEIHPFGDPKNREFYSRGAAQQLAEAHAGHINRRGHMDGLSSSWVRRNG